MGHISCKNTNFLYLLDLIVINESQENRKRVDKIQTVKVRLLTLGKSS